MDLAKLYDDAVGSFSDTVFKYGGPKGVRDMIEGQGGLDATLDDLMKVGGDAAKAFAAPEVRERCRKIYSGEEKIRVEYGVLPRDFCLSVATPEEASSGVETECANCKMPLLAKKEFWDQIHAFGAERNAIIEPRCPDCVHLSNPGERTLNELAKLSISAWRQQQRKKASPSAN